MRFYPSFILIYPYFQFSNLAILIKNYTIQSVQNSTIFRKIRQHFSCAHNNSADHTTNQAIATMRLVQKHITTCAPASRCHAHGHGGTDVSVLCRSFNERSRAPL
jgi:hypothetical protein